MHREHGGFWVHAQALRFVFRLRREVEDGFERRRVAELGWAAGRAGLAPRRLASSSPRLPRATRPPTIGMHIRVGDKCAAGHTAGVCDREFRPYRQAAEQLRERYGARHIFLATDSRRAAAACRTWAGFSCVSFDGAGHGANSVHNGHNRSSEVTLSILLDVDTLARCDYFVGSFYSSQVRCHLSPLPPTGSPSLPPPLPTPRR